MLLTKLKVKNFRSFPPDLFTEIDLSCGINTIVGKNNVGKSSIFEAIKFWQMDGGGSSSDRFKETPNEPSIVELNLKLSKAEINELFSPLLEDHPYKKEIIDYQYQVFPLLRIIKRGNSLRACFGPLEIIETAIIKRTNENSNGYATVRNWDRGLATDLRSLPLVKNIDEILSRDLDKNNPAIVTRFNLMDIIQRFRNRIVVFPEFRYRPAGIDETITSSYDGSRLAAVLSTLRNGNSGQIRKFNSIAREFSAFYPSLSLDVRNPADSDPTVWIINQEIDFDVPIQKAGAGLSDFLVFLTHIIDKKDQVFCLDTIETHFHPHAQRKLIDLIEKYSEKNQFLIITHSPIMIDSTNLENITLVRKQKGQSTIFQIASDTFDQEDELKLIRYLSAEIKEIFFADHVFIVEGPTETSAFPILSNYLGYNFNTNNVSIIPVGGNHFSTAIKLCIALEIDYLAVCDKDALSRINGSIQCDSIRITCSPIVKTMYELGLLNGDIINLLKSGSSKIQDPDDASKKCYKDMVFNLLKQQAEKGRIHVLSNDFEGVLTEAGYGQYLDEVKLDRKPIIGRHVAYRIIENKDPVPEEIESILLYFRY